MAQKGHSTRVVAVLILAVWSNNLVRGEEEPLRFLHALQARGYGELALSYLDRITARCETPPSVWQMIDLERSNSLRVASKEAYNREMQNRRIDEARMLLDKVLQENLAHPANSRALVLAGDWAVDRARERLASAKAAKTKEDRARLFDQVRKLLTSDAEPAYLKALANCSQVHAAKDEAAQRSVELRHKLAMVKYDLSQTYEDPKAPARVALLEEAAREFEIVSQTYRGTESGTLAHTWHSVCQEDLGDIERALAAYDEVLADEPSAACATNDQAALFSQVMRFRLGAIQKLKGIKAYQAEATRWLDTHRSWHRVPAYVEIALDLIRARIADSEKLPAEEQCRVNREIRMLLAPLMKANNDFQDEFAQIQSQLRTVATVEGGGNGDLDRDEALRLLDEGRLDEAATVITEAIEQQNSQVQCRQLVEMQKVLRKIRLRQGTELFSAGRYEETVKLVSPLKLEAPEDPVTPQLASLQVSALLQLYIVSLNRSDAEKATAWKRLEEAANFTIARWPNAAEGDEVRLGLGQGFRAQGKSDEALAMFENVKPGSKRYATALQLAGQTYYELYRKKKRTGNSNDKPKPIEYLAKSRERLTASLTIQKQTAKEGDRMTRQMIDTQLLLGEVIIDAGEPAKAIPYLDPLVAEIEKIVPAVDGSLVRRVNFAVDTAHRSKNGVATRDATISREGEKFAEALRRIDDQLRTDPTALNLLMEKGRILQAWAMKEPKRLPECSVYWADLRIRLGRLPKKPKVYYEVMYQCAYCVAADALATKDKGKAVQAEHLLKATLVLSPELSGPGMVSRCNELLKKIKMIQERLDRLSNEQAEPGG